MTTTVRALVFALTTLVATSTWAQAPGQTAPRGPTAAPQQNQANPRETKRDRVKKRIRALRAYTLTEELGLDTDNASKLFPVLAKYDDDFDRLLVARGLLQKQLDGAGELKDKRAIDKLIDDSLANQRAFWELEDKRIAELRKILTPAQVARLLIVLPALERKIQNQLRNAVRPKGGGRNANRGRDDEGDGDAADDDVEPAERPAPVQKPLPPANPRGPKGCDPFSDVHGCR